MYADFPWKKAQIKEEFPMKKFFKALLALSLVAAMVVPTALFSSAKELTVKGGASAGTGCGFLDGNMDVTESFDAANTSELTATVNGKTAYFNNGYLGQKHCNLGKNGDGVEKGWVQIGIVGADVKPGTNTVTVADKSGNTATFTFESTINALGTSYAKVVGDAENKTMKAEIIFNNDPGFAVGTTFEGRCHDDHGNTATFTVTAYNPSNKMYTIEAQNYITTQSLLELKVTSEGDYKGFWVTATVNAYKVSNSSGLSDTDTNAVINGATKQTLSDLTADHGDASKLNNGIGDGTGKWEFGINNLPASVTFKTATAVDATYLVLYTGNDDSGYWNRAAGAFVLYGSNDNGATWTVIKNVQSSGMKSNQNYAPTAFALTDTTAYNMYKLEVKSTLGATYFQMGELELYTGDVTITDGIPADGYTWKNGAVAYNGIFHERFEAENASVKFGEVRNAGGDYAASVSGGKFVGGFDDKIDAVTFKVNAPKSGKYVMTIGYISKEMRSFDIIVNGFGTDDYAFPEKGNSWDGDTRIYGMEIELKAGENTIVFGQKGAGAPSLDYIDITFVEEIARNPATRYEAEDAELAEKAEIRNASGDYAASVSGGKFVGGFDNEANAITFKVNADRAGAYRMTLGYISMELRSFDINVNGNFTNNFKFGGYGRSWDGDTMVCYMDVELNKGENTIIIGQGDFGAPSLDYIELEFLTGPCEHANTEKVNEKEATLEAPGYSGDIYCKDCDRVIEEGEKTYKIPENRYEAEQAVISGNAELREARGEYANSVSSGKFVGGFDGWTDAVVFTVNVEKKGTYEMVIGYIGMDTRSYDITVNGKKTEDVACPEGGRDWWGDTKTFTIEIELEAGQNTITFGQNEGKHVNNLDYIELNLVKEFVPETPDTTEPETNVPDTTEPETNVPKTGDALTIMLAISAVALAAVAVVISKKRSTVC